MKVTDRPPRRARCHQATREIYNWTSKNFLDGGDPHLDQAHHRYGRRAVAAFDRRLLRRGRLMGTDGGAWVCDYAGHAVDRGRAALPPGPLACQRGGGDYAAEKVTTL